MNQLGQPLMEMIAQGSVAVILVIFLFVTDPVIAVFVFGIIGGGYAVLTLVVAPVVRKLGLKRRQWNLERFAASGEAFGAIKDMKIRGTEGYFKDRFAKAATKFSWTQAKNRILAQTPRYAMEGLALSVRFGDPAVEGRYEDLVVGNRQQHTDETPGTETNPAAISLERELSFEREIALGNVHFSYESGGAAALRLRPAGDISCPPQRAGEYCLRDPGKTDT